MEDRLALVFALLVIHNGVMETPRVIVGRLQCSFRSEWGANIVGIDRRIGNRPALILICSQIRKTIFPRTRTEVNVAPSPEPERLARRSTAETRVLSP